MHRMSSKLARALAVATHDLDLVGSEVTTVVELEVDIADQECPDIVAEAIGVEVALPILREIQSANQVRPAISQTDLATPMLAISKVHRKKYLESQLRLHLIRHDLGNRFIEVGQDLHRKLWLQATIVNHVIQRVCEGEADAGEIVRLPRNLEEGFDRLLNKASRGDDFASLASRLEGFGAGSRHFVEELGSRVRG